MERDRKINYVSILLIQESLSYANNNLHKSNLASHNINTDHPFTSIENFKPLKSVAKGENGQLRKSLSIQKSLSKSTN